MADESNVPPADSQLTDYQQALVNEAVPTAALEAWAAVQFAINHDLSNALDDCETTNARTVAVLSGR